MFRIHHMLLAAVCVLGASACKAQTENPRNLSPQEFQERVANDPKAVVLDVRTPAEYAEGHLPGAINVDFRNQPAFTAACEDFNPENNYYVYCRSGQRSAAACDQMMTYDLPVYNMCGGYMAWTKEGLPVSK